jgi:alkanesulfonate monooxygenase SsuD/methylene tetrahydromethanopterin reductase-like flavin-dependent oxidoreductase (luciferase family)
MRIGLSGGASTVDRMISQAIEAQSDGFHHLWYASAVGGDPLVAMALAGRATTTIQLGTAVLQTYPCHPLLQANRAASVVAAMGRPGFDIGGADGPADAAIVGDEKTVASELQRLVDAGATDIWAAVFAVGADRAASRRRTREFLKTLL